MHASIRGVIDGDTAEPEDPTAFKTLDFTMDLVDLVPVDGGLHLHLEPTLDPAFGDSASLTQVGLQLYRERYDPPEHAGQ